MFQVIGLMVCVTGLVVCLYVAARSLEIARRDSVTRGPSAALAFVALASLVGGAGLVFLGYALVRPAPTPEAHTRPYFDEGGRYVTPGAGQP